MGKACVTFIRWSNGKKEGIGQETVEERDGGADKEFWRQLASHAG